MIVHFLAHIFYIPMLGPMCSTAAGAAFGAAGQRCMAISAAVFVGGMDKWRQPLIDAAKSLKVWVGGCQAALRLGDRLCSSGVGHI